MRLFYWFILYTFLLFACARSSKPTLTFFVQNAHQYWDTIQWTVMVRPAHDATHTAWDTVIHRPVLYTQEAYSYEAQSIYFEQDKRYDVRILLSFRDEVISETTSPNSQLPEFYTVCLRNNGIMYDANIRSSSSPPEDLPLWTIQADSITEAHLSTL